MNFDDLKLLLRETLDPGDVIFALAALLMILALVVHVYLEFYGTPAP